MLSLPIAFSSAIGVFAPVFSRPVWQHVKVLITGAVLAPGKRTVTAILRIMGRSAALGLSDVSSRPESRRLVASHRQSAAAQALRGRVHPPGCRRLRP